MREQDLIYNEQDVINISEDDAEKYGLPCVMTPEEATEYSMAVQAEMAQAAVAMNEVAYDLDDGFAHAIVERRRQILEALNELHTKNSLIVRGLEGKLTETLGQEALAFLAEQKSA